MKIANITEPSYSQHTQVRVRMCPAVCPLRCLHAAASPAKVRDCERACTDALLVGLSKSFLTVSTGGRAAEVEC